MNLLMLIRLMIHCLYCVAYFIDKCTSPVEVIPIRGHGREVSVLLTPFLRFLIRLGPYFMLHHDLLTPTFCRKFGLSLSHLVPEILGPLSWSNFSPQMYYLTVFKHSVSIYSFIIDLFSLILDLFDPSFLQNQRSDWVQFLITCWIRLPKTWWSTPPPNDCTCQSES